jgi:regulator of ribonuclease activity A
MAMSLPDICDDYSAELQVLEPQFTDFGGRTRFCGEVVTVKCFEDNSVVKETLGADGQGKVLVVDGGGSLHCALLGDMLAAMGAANGWRGVMVNGCVRDVEILATIDIGVRALAAHPQRSLKRGGGQLDVPVHFAGADIRPGQHLYADRNGIAVAKRKLDIDFE